MGNEKKQLGCITRVQAQALSRAADPDSYYEQLAVSYAFDSIERAAKKGAYSADVFFTTEMLPFIDTVVERLEEKGFTVEKNTKDIKTLTITWKY